MVFVVSGTTNMYPGYGIVYKNVPIFWSLPEYVPCVFKYRDRNHVTQFSASVANENIIIFLYKCTPHHTVVGGNLGDDNSTSKYHL